MSNKSLIYSWTFLVGHCSGSFQCTIRLCEHFIRGSISEPWCTAHFMVVVGLVFQQQAAHFIANEANCKLQLILLPVVFAEVLLYKHALAHLNSTFPWWVSQKTSECDQTNVKFNFCNKPALTQRADPHATAAPPCSHLKPTIFSFLLFFSRIWPFLVLMETLFCILPSNDVLAKDQVRLQIFLWMSFRFQFSEKTQTEKVTNENVHFLISCIRMGKEEKEGLP